jgi:hypothetical protein
MFSVWHWALAIGQQSLPVSVTYHCVLWLPNVCCDSIHKLRIMYFDVLSGSDCVGVVSLSLPKILSKFCVSRFLFCKLPLVSISFVVITSSFYFNSD